MKKNHRFQETAPGRSIATQKWVFRVLLLVAVLVERTARAEDPAAGDWLRALPGWTYRFPADHLVHPDYKTEWWYFTGNLTAAGGREYGYELTFFRQGVLSPAQRAVPPASGGGRSRFVQNDFKFAHFAVSDLSRGRFFYTQRLSRGAFGDTGFANENVAAPQPFVWLDDWTLTAQADGSWRIKAKSDEPVPMAIDLHLASRKEAVIEGTDGVSQKSAGVGNASHYYSYTRLATDGTLAAGASATPLPVRGESWFDHEWASNQLGADQIGWNWFCLQMDDGTEVMLYAMRRKDGSVDPVSSGTFVPAQGETQHLRREDFELRPLRTWRSPKTGAVYPLAWQVRVPAHGLDVTVRARLDDQELDLPQISYWEGATQITGTGPAGPLQGHGYMELTGYVGGLTGLQQPRAGDEPNLRTSPR